MRLSTTRSLLLLALLLVLTQASCSYFRQANNATPQPTVRPQQELPFSTKEPEIYQADAFVTAGTVTDHFFIARKHDRSRTDIFDGHDRIMTELTGASRIVIDHRQKTFYEQSSGTEPSGLVSPIASFFVGKRYSTYEEIGRNGSIVAYRVRVDGASDDIVLKVDTQVGLIVSQQFTAADGSVTVKYELRDLKLEADDSLFQVPAGYRRTAPPS